MSKVALRFGEVILKTVQYDALKSWYCRVLDSEPMMETERTAEPGPGGATQLCFIRPDSDFPFFTTLGIFDVPGLRQPDSTAPGLHHFQMRFATIGDLFDRYEALASHGIVSARSANHGPGTSLYYRDPDDNQVELSASNYLTEPEVRAFLQVKPSAETLLGLMSIQPNTSGDIARAYHSKSCDGFQSLPDRHRAIFAAPRGQRGVEP